MKIMKKSWGIKSTFDNSKTTEILGIDFIDPMVSIDEMVPTLISTGYIKDLTKK